MVMGVVINVSILEDILEDDELSNFVYVNKYSGTGQFDTIGEFLGVEAIKREDTQKTYILTHGSITATNTASLELENTNVDYQTTLAAKVILIIQGGSPPTTDFEIFQGDSADAATLQLEDFSSVSIGTSTYITSKVLSVAAGKYISVRSNTGTVAAVVGLLIE